MVALPDPDVPDVIVTHDGAPLAVQLQDADTLSDAVPVPARLSTETLDGLKTAPRQGFAAWVAVKLLPATAKVAARSAPGFAGAVTLSVALPVPAVAMVIHAGVPVTLHVQALGAVIETVEVLPPDVYVPLAGEIVGAGMHGLPDWLTESGWPPMLIVALRGAPGFEATV
jgi:hypothetical protein